MYPSWGNFGGQFSQNYGGPGPRKPSVGATNDQSSGFGGFEAPSSGSLFSSLQEQHLQQMQQLQMMHQKQLQSVLHHSNHASPFGTPASAGFQGSSWNSEVPGQATYKNDDPAAPSSGQRQPPPPPPAQANDPQPCSPPPPETKLIKTPDNNCHQNESTVSQLPTVEDDKSLPLQVTHLQMHSIFSAIAIILRYVKGLHLKPLLKFATPYNIKLKGRNRLV